MKPCLFTILAYVVLLTGCSGTGYPDHPVAVVAEPVVAVAGVFEGIDYLVTEFKNHRSCEDSLQFGGIEGVQVYQDKISDDLSGEYCLRKIGRRGITQAVKIRHSESGFGVHLKGFELEGSVRGGQIDFLLKHSVDAEQKGTFRLTVQGNLVGKYMGNSLYSSGKIYLIKRRAENPDLAGMEILGTTLFENSQWVGDAKRQNNSGADGLPCFNGNIRFQIRERKLQGELSGWLSSGASINADISAGGQINGLVSKDDGEPATLFGWVERNEIIAGIIEYPNSCKVAFWTVPSIPFD